MEEAFDDLVRTSLDEREELPKPLSERLRLCFIDPQEPFAWFSTAAPQQIRGQGWDKPYSKQSGIPEPLANQQLIKVAFSLPGADTAHTISPLKLNEKEQPWLVFPEDPEGGRLYAGVTLARFITFVEQRGGEVFMSKQVSRLLN